VRPFPNSFAIERQWNWPKWQVSNGAVPSLYGHGMAASYLQNTPPPEPPHRVRRCTARESSFRFRTPRLWTELPHADAGHQDSIYILTKTLRNLPRCFSVCRNQQRLCACDSVAQLFRRTAAARSSRQEMNRPIHHLETAHSSLARVGVLGDFAPCRPHQLDVDLMRT